VAGKKRVGPGHSAYLLMAALVLGLAACAGGHTRRASRENDAQRYLRLGQLQFTQGRTLQAIESVQKAIHLDSSLAEAHNLLGLIYLQQSDFKAAVGPLKEAIHLNPYYTDAHNQLGVAYKELKEYDKALKEFDIALNDRGYSSPEKIYLNEGYLYLEQKRFPEAIGNFQKAVVANPDYLLGILALGTAYQQAGQPDKAATEFRKVVRLGPDSPEANRARQLLSGQVKQGGS
jgi:Tfp pilus assembly protein PilF